MKLAGHITKICELPMYVMKAEIVRDDNVQTSAHCQ
jgi:hypothetical protein